MEFPMPQTIVCSVGTSAGKGIGPPEKLAEWVAHQGGVGPAAEVIFARFADVPPEGEALQKTLSAEIHSLVRIGISAADRVILLASETDDGQACVGAVERYLKRYYDGMLIEVESVKGLQVTDAQLFRREGVLNFVRYCLKAVSDFGAAQVILNPTGGFKALVPYTVLVGMLKRVPCRYIFEQSTQLLDLPPLPVAFDRAPFERYRSLIERIERDTGIPRTEWEREIHHDDRRLLEPMVELSGQEVTLSAVGLLLLDEVRTPTVLVPFLSRQAWTDCLDNLCRLKECDPFRFLHRAASDRTYLNTVAMHSNVGGGLRWLKPGWTTDRYLVSVEDWRMLVWRAIREDEVGADYPTRVTINQASGRHRYEPFTRMEFDRPIDW
jgi:putative CRISPR-associated protein (TIGR02619 family)